MDTNIKTLKRFFKLKFHVDIPSSISFTGNSDLKFRRNGRRFSLLILMSTFLFFGCNKTKFEKASVDKNIIEDTTEKRNAQEIVENNSSLESQKAEEKSNAQEMVENNSSLERHEADSIQSVINLFKAKDLEKISNKIHFPLNREFPIPPIRDKVEFKKRFDQVFDENLIEMISESKIEQWSEVGYRGIMLDGGVLWMANSDGVITAVNYQSEFEKNLKKQLISKQRENLHESLRNFEQPTYKIATKNHLIRIDELSEDRYRYASWGKGKKESSKPDLILENGKLEFAGSGGNHVISFPNKNFTYKIYRNIVGKKDTPEISVVIEKDGTVISNEDGKLLLE